MGEEGSNKRTRDRAARAPYDGLPISGKFLQQACKQCLVEARIERNADVMAAADGNGQRSTVCQYQPFQPDDFVAGWMDDFDAVAAREAVLHFNFCPAVRHALYVANVVA